VAPVDRVRAEKIAEVLAFADGQQGEGLGKNPYPPSAPRRVPNSDLDLDGFLTSTLPTYDWLIPRIIERQDRVLIVGGEGMGKTTLLRQIAVQAAAGIHPFTLQPARDDRQWLGDRVRNNRPDMLICGPLYKLAGGDPNNEENTQATRMALDQLRADFDIAVVIDRRRCCRRAIPPSVRP
jgi:hypothetical protein